MRSGIRKGLIHTAFFGVTFALPFISFAHYKGLNSELYAQNPEMARVGELEKELQGIESQYNHLGLMREYRDNADFARNYDLLQDELTSLRNDPRVSVLFEEQEGNSNLAAALTFFPLFLGGICWLAYSVLSSRNKIL